MRRLTALLLLLALLAAALVGCGAILVEDREPVLVGMCEYSHKVPENAAGTGVAVAGTGVAVAGAGVGVAL